MDGYHAKVEAEEAISPSEVVEDLRHAISGCVANSNGNEYAGYYPITGDCLIFGAQAIDVDDGANFMIREAGLRWLLDRE